MIGVQRARSFAGAREALQVRLEFLVQFNGKAAVGLTTQMELSNEGNLSDCGDRLLQSVNNYLAVNDDVEQLPFGRCRPISQDG